MPQCLYFINGESIHNHEQLQDFIEGTYGRELYTKIIEICSQILFIFPTEIKSKLSADV